MLKDKPTGAGSVEGLGDFRIPRLVSGNRQRAIFEAVDRVGLFADILRLSAIGDDADPFFRIRIVPKRKCGLKPIVGLSTVELQGFP